MSATQESRFKQADFERAFFYIVFFMVGGRRSLLPPADGCLQHISSLPVALCSRCHMSISCSFIVLVRCLCCLPQMIVGGRVLHRDLPDDLAADLRLRFRFMQAFLGHHTAVVVE